jgi:hypothetical protein
MAQRAVNQSTQFQAVIEKSSLNQSTARRLIDARDEISSAAHHRELLLSLFPLLQIGEHNK